MGANDSRPGRRPRRRPPAVPKAAAIPRAAAAAPGAGAHAFRRAGFVITLAWAVLFAPQLAQRKAFVIGDAGSLRAFAEFSAAEWRTHHERAHWNPYVFCGIPATVSLQDSRPQYLPDVALTAFDALHRSPAWPPLAIPLLIHLAGMLCAAALARSLWGLRPAAMVCAGLVWGLMPSLIVPFAYGHDAQLMATSLMPAVLLGIERVVASARPSGTRAGAFGLAAAVGALLLAAYPQAVVLALPLAAAFALQRLAATGRWGRLAWLAAAVACGVAIGAAVWWPGLLYNAHSVRGGGVVEREVARWSLAWRDLPVMAWPWAVGFGGETYWGGLASTDFPPYVGAGVMVLACLGLGRDGHSRGSALLFAGTAVVGVLLALGVNAGPAYALFRALPLWSSFRLAVNALMLTQLAAALLAARGVERMCSARRGDRGMWIAGAALAAAIVLAALLVAAPHVLAGAARAAHPEMPVLAVAEAARHAALDLALRAVLALASLVLLAFARGAWASRGAAVAIAILALDLASIDVPFLRRATGDLATLEHPAPTAAATLTAREPLQRVIDADRGRLFGNDWIRWRARSLGGNHPAVNRAWDDLLQRGLFNVHAVRRMLAVKYAEVGQGELDPETFERVPDVAGVWRLKQALPRAWAVPDVRGLDDEDRVLEALAHPRFDPAIMALTSDASAAATFPGAANCRIRWLDDRPDHLELATDAGAASFIVLADAWFPGWSATLDGRPLAIARVNHMLRGVAVPPGSHHVAMRYVPAGWSVATAVTRLALALWLAGLLAWLLGPARRARQLAAGARGIAD